MMLNVDGCIKSVKIYKNFTLFIHPYIYIYIYIYTNFYFRSKERKKYF